MARDQGPVDEVVRESPAQPAAAAPPPRPSRNGHRRRRLFLILALVIVAAGAAWGVYWLFVGSRHVETDDAYVQASTAEINALVSGPLIQVPAYETQVVKKGQVLAVIDPADYRLAVARARADLDQAGRRVRQYFANDRALSAQAAARSAEIAHAQAELRRAQVEYDRRKGLAASGAVSADELTAAETALAQARSALAQAQATAKAASEQQRAANVLIAGADVDSNPEVVAARARLQQAELDLSRTVIRAPVAGVVTRNDAEVGQRVQPGGRLMTVIPIQEAYVEANFKEVQLRKVRVGQPVTLVSDLYGKGVKYHGRVVGFAGGTGSSQAVIPAQNATGNWIKVVQRVPVRIALDPKELAKHPLRVGLSMTADIDVGG
jgi:membrane fusion protein (multidrug efflux system)